MTIRWALLQLRHHRLLTAAAVVLGSLTIFTSTGLMTASGYLISRAALRPPILELTLVIVAVRFFGISRAAVRYAERLVSHDLTFRLLLRLRCWLYERLEPIIPSHRVTHHSGDLLSRLISDVETLQNLYLRVASPVIVAGLIGCLSVAALFLINPAIALIFAVGLLLCGVALPLVVHRLAQRSAQQQIAVRALLQRHLVDSIRGMDEMLALGIERRRLQEYERLTGKLTYLQRRQGQIAAIHNFTSHLLLWTTIVSIVLLAVSKIQTGEFPAILLAAIAFGVFAAFEAVQPLPVAWQYIEQAGEASRRIYEVIQERPLVRESTNPALIPDEPSYAFRNVSFSYPGMLRPAIREVSFDLPFRHKVAILGPSGSGKSTIVNILCRFFDPQEGVVLLGKDPLPSYSIHEVRAQLAVVLQHPHLFNASIRENLLLARPGATDLALFAALDSAGLASFVQRLPEGLKTNIGSEGLRLSGGQRRRLVLAQAFLKKAPILALDEATANIDSETERDILDRAFQMTADRTLIVITHRPEKLPPVDAVYRFVDGRLTSPHFSRPREKCARSADIRRG